MQKYKHNLVSEFPKYERKIQQLKEESATFRTLVKEYHSIDHRIAGLNATGIPITDAYYESLKIRRVYLKDKIFYFIRPRE